MLNKGRKTMKRIAYLWLAGMMLAGLFTALAGAQDSQSLGAYARALRREKKPTPARQYDNDNLPKTDKLSVVGNSDNSSATSDSASNKQASDASAQTSNDQKPASVAPGQSPQERQKVYSEWKDKLSAQKEKVDLLSRELDVAQREYKLRAAAFYADAGNRLRNSAAWDKEDTQYKKDIAEKQKAVDAAKKDLDDLQEQARKAGVPASARE